MNKITKIDLSTWRRFEHYKFFSGIDIPQYNLTFEIDVTKFYDYTKKNGISFFCAMVYAVTTAANHTDAFCFRIHGEDVVQHSELVPSFTFMNKGDDLFKIVNCPIEGGLIEYSKMAHEKAVNQKNYLPESYDESDDNYLYITSTPWINFTGFTNEMKIDRNDAIPRIAWGKFCKKDGKLMMPMSLELNHRLIHGYDTAQFYNFLQSYLDSPF